MTRIDTKELRDAITRCPSTCGTGNLVLKAADELDRLYLDHTPLSREELETVLKEQGWSVGVPLNDWYIVNSNLEWGDSNDTCYVTDNANLQIQHFGGSFCIPLSAVTRATLRSCGVIK